MKPEAQRIAIAEACGWTEIIELNKCLIGWPPANRRGYREMLPDYLNDLNAMHEAFNALNQGQKELFSEMLCWVLYAREWNKETPEQRGPNGYFEIPKERAVVVINATAAPRAETLLRTVGKWDESST